MTERTDKPTQKPGRRPPRKGASKARRPEAKRAETPDRSPGKAESAAAPAGPADTARSGLAPDPATVVFGSNRPILATPPKLPEGSGLRFSGPSAGTLKASGPQPSSPKASGLTFTAAKSGPATTAKPRPPAAVRPSTTSRPVTAKKPEVGRPEVGRPEVGKPEVGKPGTGKPDAQAAGAMKPTKPAIAPQVTSPRFGKERPIGSFAILMLALTLIGGGLAFWMQPEREVSAPQPPVAPQVAAASEAPAVDAAAPDPMPLETPTGPADEATSEAAAPAGLSAAEIGEIQQLLSFLDLDPGRSDGVLTAATTDAIRNYQEMAGLPADGEADRALLEELRSVAALYGG